MKHDSAARARFMAKVQMTHTCWNWTAYRTLQGYGKFGVGGNRSALAHRVSYEMHVGEIPEGLVIDHLCSNTSCVNPEHLEAVTQSENVRRAVRHVGPFGVSAANAAKTHCPEGHELAGDNLVQTKLRQGKRLCRTCANEYQRGYHSRRRRRLAAEV